jgi:hypothetical protein
MVISCPDINAAGLTAGHRGQAGTDFHATKVLSTLGVAAGGVEKA